jgi:hypothetical protein
MPCLHGLDENNCPTCRIIKSTLPINSFKGRKSPGLKIKSPFFKYDNRLKENLSEDITAKKLNITHPSLNLISKPPFINEIPHFENKIFLERAKGLDIAKDDNYGISKKIPLENPEWQFEEEE